MIDFFTSEEECSIVNAIKEAEKNTSGEIRVHIEEGDKKVSPLDRTKEVFRLLGMENTQLRNGILFYMDVKNHLFAVYGDDGINKVVPLDFWDEIKDVVIDKFKNKHFSEGLSLGILKVGDALKKYFPYQKDDVNELSDEITKGDI